MKKIFCFIILVILLTSCKKQNTSVIWDEDFKNQGTLSVTSTSIDSGFWREDIGKNFGNRTPEITYTQKKEAAVYVVYMIDESANNFMHWKLTDVKGNHLPIGINAGEYIGPYPPKGQTHDYYIYVFALKEPLQEYPGTYNSPSLSAKNIYELLN